MSSHKNNKEQRMPRREFVKTAAAGIAAVSIPAASYARILGANDRVRVGIVGFSDRFRQALLPAFKAAGPSLDFEIVAVSDIWNRRRDEGVAEIERVMGAKPRAFRNNEEMYAAKLTDAVMISTPDFLHAYHGADAIRDAVKRSDRVVQIGTQRRSAANYQAANDFIRSGKFGDIVMAEMTWNVNQPGRWRRPQLVSTIKETDTDWKRFLAYMPYEAWDPRKYLEYRLFWPYSSGIPDQWMVHQIDTVHWFTGFPRPRSVVANGGVYLWKDGRKNWDTATIVFEYGPLDDPTKGFQVVYASRMTNGAGGTKELYYSNAGMLNLDTNEISPEGGLTDRYAAEMGMKANQLPKMKLSEVAPTETAANTGGDSSTTANVRNWMECVRSRGKTNANIDAGYSHAVALCMTVAAIHTGRKVMFDDGKQDIVMG